MMSKAWETCVTVPVWGGGAWPTPCAAATVSGAVSLVIRFGMRNSRTAQGLPGATCMTKLKGPFKSVRSRILRGWWCICLDMIGVGRT
eukprot:4233534-Pyramimonas_sp.AAC.1